MLTFQEIIIKLQEFWSKEGCLLQQSYDIETGAGTFNPDTFLRAIGPEPYQVCNVEISKRPTDGRYGTNPNRLQKFHQFQVLLKPSPADFQKTYLRSLEALGFSLKDHDIRFVHDDWESPTQGAWGLGWEVWCDGMEVTQFTYFQMVGGIALEPIAVELAYGLERIAMFLQGVSSVYDVQYNDRLTYGDVFLVSEIESSHYNFEEANTEMWKRHFEDFERESKKVGEAGFPTIAYDFAIKASHAFNILDARSAISTTARVDLIHRIKNLACQAAKSYLKKRHDIGFPLLKEKVSVRDFSTDFPLPSLPFRRKEDDFLFEIVSEELPASFIPTALIELEKLIASLFQEHSLSYHSLAVYGSPRRLALYAEDLSYTSRQELIKRKGPAVTAAFNEFGELTPQGKGFASSLQKSNITLKEIKEGGIKELSIGDDGYLYAHIQKPVRTSFEILQKGLVDLIKDFPFPKKMRWGHYSIGYARPILSIIALHGKSVIPFEIVGIRSGNTSYGHHQLSPKSVKISHPKKYLSKLRKRSVLASVKERKQSLEKQLEKFEAKLGAHVPHKEEIISEVLYLSENPIVGLYHFDEKFLNLPEELLISEMIHHQRLFPLKSAAGTLLKEFLVAVDKKPTELILKNNQAVLRARLSDGLFLYDQDRKTPLSAHREALRSIIFHKELGTLYDKTKRIEALSLHLSTLLNLPYPERASLLCKADLVTSVVYEFPELQGVMGKYYALLEGETEETAKAIEEHYWPLTEGGRIPTTNGGKIIALADKLDNLIEYTRIGLRATSSKDPYGLRRAAIGVLRILIEGKLFLDLSKVGLGEELLDFLKGRMKGLLLDLGFKSEEIGATLSCGFCNPYETYLKTEALHKFRRESDAFEELYTIYKRAKGQIQEQREQKLYPELLQEVSEKELYLTLSRLTPILEEALLSREYLSALKALTTLNDPLNTFFNSVRVLADQEELRHNRIALLQHVFDKIAKLVDLSALS